MKVKDLEFLNYVRSYDIFCLLKTLIENEFVSYYQNYFSDHELFWLSATRTSKFSRASGGMLYGCKKNLVKKEICKYVKILNLDLVRVKIGQGILYILPVYLNLNNWNENFEISNLLVEYSNLNFIMIGDFNARLGQAQNYESVEDWEEIGFEKCRKSKDGVIKREGKKV